LVKELIKWEKCQKNMIEGTTKREPKKDVCHSTRTNVFEEIWTSHKCLSSSNISSKG
jgi:hypothetical protein